MHSIYSYIFHLINNGRGERRDIISWRTARDTADDRDPGKIASMMSKRMCNSSKFVRNIVKTQEIFPKIDMFWWTICKTFKIICKHNQNQVIHFWWDICKLFTRHLQMFANNRKTLKQLQNKKRRKYNYTNCSFQNNRKTQKVQISAETWKYHQQHFCSFQ